jgi:hypothetical protein
MGFNKRKMEDRRRQAAEQEAAHVARQRSKSLRMPTANFRVE